MTAPANALLNGAPDLRWIESGETFRAAFSITVVAADR
jgi:hypothetical protein